jgi:hypothetical protein
MYFSCLKKHQTGPFLKWDTVIIQEQQQTITGLQKQVEALGKEIEHMKKNN